MAYTSRHFRSYPLLVAVGFLLFISMLMTSGCEDDLEGTQKALDSADGIHNNFPDKLEDAESPSAFLTPDTFSESHGKQGETDISEGISKSSPPGPSAPWYAHPERKDADYFQTDAGAESGSDANQDSTSEASKTEDVMPQDAASDNTDSTDNSVVSASPKTSYYSADFGYSFDYPTEWKLFQQSEEKFVLETKKIVEPGTTQTPDRMRVTVTYLDKPDDETFDKWFGKFQKGSEEVVFKNTTYTFVAEDTEGPFGRTFYRKIYAAGGLKIEFLFEPGYTIPLEEESAGWKNYADATTQYRQELWNQFLEMLESIKEDM